MKKRILAAVVAFAYTTSIWWLGGINFDTRGADLVFWWIVSGMVSGMAFAYPFDD